MSVRCFYIERTGQTRLTLRVYEDGPTPCPGFTWHNAHAPLMDVAERKVPYGAGARDADDWRYEHDGPQRAEDVTGDARFPTACDRCGYAFTAEGTRQVFTDRLYRRVDTGEVRPLRAWAKEPGAMWDAEWMAMYPAYVGPDGRCLTVVCPDGDEWSIDGQASNCTMKDDHVHRCWVRHGEPPNITVDKNGLTCQAGGGSIQTHKGYHGFLRNGAFEPA